MYNMHYDAKMFLPTLPEPNLITGVGHGHPRGWSKVENNHKKKLQKKTKIQKASKRRNRK